MAKCGVLEQLKLIWGSPESQSPRGNELQHSSPKFCPPPQPRPMSKATLAKGAWGRNKDIDSSQEVLDVESSQDSLQSSQVSLPTKLPLPTEPVTDINDPKPVTHFRFFKGQGFTNLIWPNGFSK